MAVANFDVGLKRRRSQVPCLVAFCIIVTCFISFVINSDHNGISRSSRSWFSLKTSYWQWPSKAGYREYLEANEDRRHLDNFPLSRTLGFDRIYVVSLKKRVDRRERMIKIAKALDLDFTFFDATDGKDQGPGQAAVAWIAERVTEERKYWQSWIRQLPGHEKDKFDEPAVTARTAKEVDAEIARNQVQPILEKRGWLSRVPERAHREALDQAWDGNTWTEWLQAAQVSQNHSEWFNITPNDPYLDVVAALTEPNNKPFRQLTPGVLATWNSHWRLMSLIEARDETSLVLEDDVDFEWDVARLWGSIEEQMIRHNVKSDMTFLGHCWGDELAKPATIHPLLHPSTRPKCLHGYAITGRTVTRMRSHMLNPRTAYQSAVDQELPILIQKGVLGQVFSIVPPLIIQAKDSATDVQLDSVKGGTGSNWHGVLRDSVLERLWRDEHPDQPYMEVIGDAKTDPALRVGMHIVPKPSSLAQA